MGILVLFVALMFFASGQYLSKKAKEDQSKLYRIISVVCYLIAFSIAIIKIYYDYFR